MDWGRVLEVVLTVVGLPLLGWVMKTIIEIKTALIGIDGQNGIRADLRELNERVRALERAAPWARHPDGHHVEGEHHGTH